MPVQPKSIVYLRPDTIGDLVLFSSALSSLLGEWPNARHTVIVRPGYEALAPLFPAKVGWELSRLNPFKQKPSECLGEFNSLLETISGLKPDLILAPALNRTWLEAAVAAHFKGVRSIVLGSPEPDPLFSAALRLDLGVDAATAFTEVVEAKPGVRDVDNLHRLVEQLLAHAVPESKPKLSVPASASTLAKATLASFQLPARGWAAVFAGGLANVKIKAWPAERFAELIVWLEKDKGISSLLMGHQSEGTELEHIAEAAARQGGAKPRIWLGADGELPFLAGLLGECRFYVGHDTGAMHIAGAVDRPVVGIFGGGHWPRFRPSAEQTISVVQPLPCFGCNWDCHFVNGPCVGTLGLAPVKEGVGRVLDRGEKPYDEVIESRDLPAEAVQLIAAATPRYAALQADRIDRQHKIEELKHETNFKDTEIIALKKAADDRERELDSIKAELEAECAGKDREIEQLKAEADSKDEEIGQLKKETDGKDREISGLKAEADSKDGEITQLKKETDVKDTEIDSLKAVCNEREAVILKLDGHVKHFQGAVAEKDTHILNLEGDRKAATEKAALAEAARAEAEKILRALPPNAAEIAKALQDKDVHIANIEALLALSRGEAAGLKTQLAERDQSIANFVGGYAGLELAKHYGRLLAQKEAVLQNLHHACVEREGVIVRLAAEATKPTDKLRKLWIALDAYVQAKVVRPFNTWLFRKVVEEHWMQIGVLRHYEPRPIAWDKRIPKAKLSGEQLPKVAIVTPSYKQPAFVESTIVSILNQDYPKLVYVVQDGGSTDATQAVIAKHASKLRHWESAPDKGQADAVRKGFAKIEPELGPDDVMAWLNSDDLAAPRALRYVAEYFTNNPSVDVIYGHRIIIDGHDKEVGRWIMPKHDAPSIEWIDYIPQETLYWRKRAWDLVGGIDPSFQFALDWDIIARFHRAGCKIVRVPYFLGCFRIHDEQKTNQAIHTVGAQEMARIRARFHSESPENSGKIDHFARKTRFRGALVSRLQSLGIRW